MIGGEGAVHFTVWPAYIGLAADGQEFLPVDQRAQIQWRPEQDTIVGAARCWVPKGVYTRFAFYQSPNGPESAHMVLPHPHVQHADGWITIDPICNTDPVAKAVSGIAR